MTLDSNPELLVRRDIPILLGGCQRNRACTGTATRLGVMKYDVPPWTRLLRVGQVQV
jgi:hypothetical protein